MNRHLTAASLSIVSLLSACSASAERRLEGRVFDIPRANDISDNDKPFFLPALDPSDGFSFYLNPSASRSEEHTSELQSLLRISYAVFCLKKKTSDNST